MIPRYGCVEVMCFMDRRASRFSSHRSHLSFISSDTICCRSSFGLIGLCSAQLIKQPHQGIPCNSKLIISRRVLGKLTSTRWASTHRCRFMYTCAVPHNRCMRLLPFSKRSFPISKPWMHFHSMHHRNSAGVFWRPSTLSNTMRQRPPET